MNHVVVVNKSTLVTNADVRTMAHAVATQVRLHAAPAWGKQRCTVDVLVDETKAPAGSTVIGVLDDSDQAGALGWHTESAGGVTFGRVFARPVLDNGGDALHKPLSVASVLSHEVLEAFVDPSCSDWWDDGHGKLYAAEVGDPVEADSYAIDGVTVSNFVLPAWRDPQANPAGPFDWMRTTTRPFQLSKGGYVVYRTAGAEHQSFAEHIVYGPDYPAWRHELKATPLARTQRRMRATA